MELVQEYVYVLCIGSEGLFVDGVGKKNKITCGWY